MSINGIQLLKEDIVSNLNMEDCENKDNNEEYNLEDDEDDYPHLFQSIRSSTGLEVGVRVTWPDTEPMELSTCLPSQEIAPMFHGTQWAGTRVWKAAIVALQYLLEEKSPLKEKIMLKSKDPSTTASATTNCNTSPPPRWSNSFSCLELGCGLGVPGMLLHRLFPETSRVVLTDCDALLPQLRHNVAQNFGTLSRVTAEALDWENEQDLVRLLQEASSIHEDDCAVTANPTMTSTRMHAFDVVLNCDCIYEPLYGESWKALLKVQIALLEHNPDTLMLTSLERRKFDGADRYLAAMEVHPLVDRVDLVHTDNPVEIYRIYSKEASSN